MKTDAVRDDFDEIARLTNTARELDEHETWIAQKIGPGESVLDVGCGTGALTRAVSRVAAYTVGLDLSEGMIDVARSLSAMQDNLTFENDDLMDRRGEGTFDTIVSVAALHHLDLGEALAKLRSMLRSKGRLFVVDVLASKTLSELPWSAVSSLARRLRPRRRPLDAELAAVWKRHASHERLLSLRRVRRHYRTVLPGAVVTRHLGWRYRASWTAPTPS